MEEMAVATPTGTTEKDLEASGALMISEAKGLVISTNEDYERAGKVLVEIKTRMKQVTDYWKNPKQTAAAAHKQICDKEKEMLNPLKEAEKIIKNSMVMFQSAIEEARRKAEEEARKRQQEETDRLLAQALEAEANGDESGAAMNMAMAQMIDDMAPVQAIAKPVAAGTSVRKTWKARVIDPKLVPAYVNGFEVRQINMSALNNLAKMTNGTMEVPGVEFYLDSSLTVRA